MTLTWAKAAHETIVRAATAINVVRKVFILNAPFRKPASFRNRSERARCKKDNYATPVIGALAEAFTRIAVTP
jgi:hypothetical protein